MIYVGGKQDNGYFSKAIATEIGHAVDLDRSPLQIS